ncbi:MAG: hypothetical protein GY936_07820 [Ignavibacteriae bacterium]|nr:hypothetical protein [Ignavibacteriota bacterium]
MNTKLTLKLDKSIIENAKEYAKEKNISLSKMIENYLQALTKKRSLEMEISPLVESLIGVIGEKKIDYKKDYTKFLANKYK